MSAAPATTLFVARHGQSEWNHQGRITGQLDIGLSPEGRQQGEAIARCLADEPLDAIVTSALQRTIATAQPTASAKGLPIATLAALNEIHLGVLQGRLRDERDPEAQALWAAWQADMWGHRVPGGERFDEFAARVEGALASILREHRGRRVLVVGHRATNRVLLGILLGWPRERWPQIRLGNKRFYRIAPGTPAQVTTYWVGGEKAGASRAGFVM